MGEKTFAVSLDTALTDPATIRCPDSRRSTGRPLAVERRARRWKRRAGRAGPRSRCRPACPAGRDRRPRTAGAGARRRLRAWRARSVRRGARPADRHRHRQERPCRAQDRRDPGLDRHAGAVRPCGRGQPRRSRHDRRRGRDPRLVEFRRERRTGRHHRLFAPLRDPADRDHRRPRTRRWRRPPMSCCCCRARPRRARWGWRRRPRRR